MAYVIRKAAPPGKSALATEATAPALAAALVNGDKIAGLFLKSFDLDTRGGKGECVWTDDPAKAMRFDSFTEAAECWRRPSKKYPLRPDGKPNRPLTAFSVTIEQIAS